MAALSRLAGARGAAGGSIGVMTRRRWLLALAALPVCALGRTAASTPLPRAAAVPGAVARIDLSPTDEAPRVMLDDRRVLVARTADGWTALAGIGLDVAPGRRLQLRIDDAAGRRTIGVPVRRKDYAVQRLKVEPRHVHLSAEDLARHERERAHLQAVLRTWSAPPPATLQLVPPAAGRRSSSFGLRRVFNGEARNPHNGMDIAAPTGTPVIAAAAGEVVDRGDYFFNGRTVIVDHGQGFLTLYCHLDEVGADAGARLAAGEALGTVGASGRTTGPHLHFSVYLNGSAVDPALFLPAPQAG